MPKIIATVEDLASICEALRANGKTIVHCHGVFDLLHIGHIRYLQRAKRFGDILVVTVTPDRFVNKGPHRPAFNEDLRLDSVAALECVDCVVLNRWPTAVETIRLLRPHVYAKGAEFRDRKTPELQCEEESVAEVGGTVEFITEFTSSSSTLINTYLPLYAPEVESYLSRIRQRFTIDDVMRPLESAKSLRVLVVGEAILDEYYYCSTIGHSMKSPTLATKYQSHARFIGGALAVANHIAAFCDRVDLFAMLGEFNSTEEWIREHLRDTVSPAFHRKRDAPTIVKQKYHDSYYHSTLFAMDYFDDEPMAATEAATVDGFLEERLPDYDLVVVADYGHQFLGDSSISLLCGLSRRLAVTTQADPANFGLHTISRYVRCDYACLAQRDLELDCRSRTADLRIMLSSLARRLKVSTATVTTGSAGCLCCDCHGEFHEAAGLSTRVVDRSGAGEAFFAVSALCAAENAPLEIQAFCGNLAGSEGVATVGTPTIDALSFRRHAESLLK